MQEFKHVVISAEGIHARPATELTKLVRSLSSSVRVSYQGKTVPAGNVMKLFALNANQGAEVTFIVEGTNEVADAKTLEEYCKRNV